MSVHIELKGLGNLGLSLPLRVLPISGKDLYTFTNDLNSPAAPFPTAGSISKSPPKSLLAISQLLGEGRRVNSYQLCEEVQAYSLKRDDLVINLALKCVCFKLV